MMEDSLVLLTMDAVVDVGRLEQEFLSNVELIAIKEPVRDARADVISIEETAEALTAICRNLPGDVVKLSVVGYQYNPDKKALEVTVESSLDKEKFLRLIDELRSVLRAGLFEPPMLGWDRLYRNASEDEKDNYPNGYDRFDTNFRYGSLWLKGEVMRAQKRSWVKLPVAVNDALVVGVWEGYFLPRELLKPMQNLKNGHDLLIEVFDVEGGKLGALQAPWPWPYNADSAANTSFYPFLALERVFIGLTEYRPARRDVSVAVPVFMDADKAARAASVKLTPVTKR